MANAGAVRAYPGKKRLKTWMIKVIFWFLGRGAQAAALLDSRIMEEVEAWEEGTTVLLKVECFGPAMLIGKRQGRLMFLGLREDEANLVIFFKNIDAALLVLTGRIGIDRAFAESRYSMRGDINFGMSLVRCLCLVEAYLFPAFITRRILKRMPKKQISSLRVYGRIIFNR